MKTDITMNEEEHMLYSELFAEHIGLVIDEEDSAGLARAVIGRMDQLGLSSFLDYYRLLVYRFDSELAHLSPSLSEPDGCFFQDRATLSRAATSRFS